ncbi:hypothetical protein FHX42_005219 [Saccharopolyspora lacisalsi]|uniref:Aminoglycoside phosphotransferase domain-containing protein n=1 Tax=Halosaccharopolyspora lacisalsi TaxID=1000566 RepID=A0A839E0T6_9PSEU|nr:phosphotransferase [Halosaccharopolyspora lacisalsi]MBA8827812.1 hypothetical protein [Halosaccharopolyspora lacisalsi]
MARHTKVLDLREASYEDVVAQMQWRTGVGLDRATVVYGESGATAGFRTTRGTWLRVQHRHCDRTPPWTWTGLEDAARVVGVRKPGWIQAVEWVDVERNVVWRADELELVTAAVVGGLTHRPEDLPDEWWQRLAGSLELLQAYSTDRIALSQAHLSDRIRSVFGDRVDTTVTEWRTAHGDLHWGNVTVDGELLDWEAWGLGPRGLDAACLWGISLTDPLLAERIEREFAAELSTRSGRLCRLMVCATAIRAAQHRADAEAVAAPARDAAETLVAELAEYPAAAR